jgi:hypothetical protein
LVVILPGAESWASAGPSPADLQTFLRRNPQVDHLVGVGAGLEPWELAGLGPSVELTNSPRVGWGLAMIRWDHQLEVGDALLVTGHIVGLSDQTIRVTLEGPAGRDVSVELQADPGGSPVPFTLETLPPGVGRFLYRMTLTDLSDSTESVEWIDVRVVTSAMPSILWLEDAPNFETKYLKQWLADQGVELAVRSRVSLDRYHFEFHNLESLSLGRIDGDLLSRFDLLIAEQRAWERLSAPEESVTRQAAAETGFGVLVRLNPGRPEISDLEWPLGFTGTRIEGVDYLMVSAGGAVGTQASPVEIPPFELNPEPGMEPIFTDDSGRVLAMARPVGRGHFGVTLLRETFPWVLEGYPEAQRSYWRRLVETVARPATSPSWLLTPGPILVDEPLEVTLQWDPQPGAVPAAWLSTDGESTAAVALRQDPVLGDQWAATIWPSRVGWHHLEAEGAILEFHVGESHSWASWRRERRRQATRLAALRPRGSDSGKTAVVDLPLARLPFYLAFLVSLGWLWLDERRGF